MRTRISEVMQPCSSFVSSRDLVTKARSLMRTSGLRTLPVVDDGKLTGIITARQMLRVTSTRSNIPVAGLMFPPRLVATPDDTIGKLINDMIELEISAVPVVKSASDRTISGIVRLDDILRHISKSSKPKLTVGRIMKRKVVTCTPADEISRVWDIMEKAHFSGLPVVRYNKRKRALEVVGMITRSDIIRSGATRLAEESDKGRFRSPPRVQGLMRTPAITASPNMSLPDAIDLMLKRNIGRLPVVEEGKLVGIVSRGDVIKACL